jgi:hypothetical protein
MEATVFGNPQTLPIPFRYGQRVITKASFDTPELSSIANVRKYAESNVWKAMKAYIDGSIIALIDSDGEEITGNGEIKKATESMPIQSAEVLSVAIALSYNEDDYVEGLYECPLCKNVVKAIDDGEDDTRDRIRNLSIVSCESADEMVHIELKNHIVIKGKSRADKEEHELVITEFSMRHPTIRDGIASMGKYGATDELRQQFAMFTEALVSINGEEVSQAERAQFGMMIFEKMKAGHDTREINRQTTQYGISGRVKKVCRCGRRFDATIETRSFFAFALRQT